MIPEFFPAFHRDYPGITIELMEDSGSRLETALLDDAIDLAVISVLQEHLYDDRFEMEIIFDEPILYAVPTEHPAVQKTLASCQYSNCIPIAPTELVNEIPLIFTKQGQKSTQLIKNFLQKNNLNPEVVIETINLTTAINLVVKNVGAAFVPAEGAVTCKHPGEVTFFLIDSPDLIWHLAVIYRRGRYLGRLPRMLIDAMKSSLGNQKF